MDQAELQAIQASQNGDAQAFGQLYDKYFKKIYSFIFYKVGHRETTEDLVSLTFTKALEHLPKFRVANAYFSAWLYRIARNTVIDYHRGRKVTEDIDQPHQVFSLSNVEEDMTRQQQFDQVKAKLDILSPEQREIVVMRLWDELSYREISQVVGKSEGSCKVAFSRAIKSLRLSLSIVILFVLTLIS